MTNHPNRSKQHRDINLQFTTSTGDYPGAFHRDYFRDGGLERAREAATAVEAEGILSATYLGPDVDGVGLTWSIAR